MHGRQTSTFAPLPRTRRWALPIALTVLVLGAVACASGPDSDNSGDSGEAIGQGTSSSSGVPAGGGGSAGGQGGAGGELLPSGGGGIGPTSAGGTAGEGGSGGDTGMGGGGALNDCCSLGAAGGCADPAIEQCVCAADPYCCQTQWDDLCVELGASDCGAPCDDGSGGSGAGGEGGAGGAGGGCVDPPDDCVSCIIDQCGLDCILQGNCDPSLGALVLQCLVFTCGQECLGWDPGDCGGGCDPCEPPPNACCSEQPGPGCAADPQLQACVCQQDDYCCNTAWDTICVDEIEQLGCGTCS